MRDQRKKKFACYNYDDETFNWFGHSKMKPIDIGELLNRKINDKIDLEEKVP